MENEGFAEGFARYIMQKELQPSMGASKAQVYLDAMQAYRIMRFELGNTINRAGYARPHSPELLEKILAHTKVWEKQEYAERTA